MALLQRKNLAPPKKKERTPEAVRLETALANFGSQTKAGEELGISPRQLRKYLASESPPSVDVLTRIAQRTGYNLEWLITGEGTPRALHPSANPIPHDVPMALGLRHQVYKALAEVYTGTPWELDPRSDLDEFLLLDATKEVSTLPVSLWEDGIRILAEAHKAALGRMQRKRK